MRADITRWVAIGKFLDRVRPRGGNSESRGLWRVVFSRLHRPGDPERRASYQKARSTALYSSSANSVSPAFLLASPHGSCQLEYRVVLRDQARGLTSSVKSSRNQREQPAHGRLHVL